MRRVLVSLVLSGLLLAGVQPAMAQQFGYSQGYGYQTAQPQYPLAQKVVVGGALVGLGFAAGRLTAPQPYYNQGYGYGNQGYGNQGYGYGPQFGGGYYGSNHHHHGNYSNHHNHGYGSNHHNHGGYNRGW